MSDGRSRRPSDEGRSGASRGAALTVRLRNTVEDTSHRLVDSLAANARDLINAHSIDDLEAMLVQIVSSAVATVPGADAAGITMARAKQIESRAPFNDSVLQLDRLQAELGQGPCLGALTGAALGGVVVVDDLFDTDADRWPLFAAKAEAYGYRSMCSTQLSTDGGPHAALNVYALAPKAFDVAAQTIAGLFGVQASPLLYGAEHAASLGVALGSRDLIGQAKGILMERFAVDGDQAFQGSSGIGVQARARPARWPGSCRCAEAGPGRLMMQVPTP